MPSGSRHELLTSVRSTQRLLSASVSAAAAERSEALKQFRKDTQQGNLKREIKERIEHLHRTGMHRFVKRKDEARLLRGNGFANVVERLVMEYAESDEGEEREMIENRLYAVIESMRAKFPPEHTGRKLITKLSSAVADAMALYSAWYHHEEIDEAVHYEDGVQYEPRPVSESEVDDANELVSRLASKIVREFRQLTDKARAA